MLQFLAFAWVLRSCLWTRLKICICLGEKKSFFTMVKSCERSYKGAQQISWLLSSPLCSRDWVMRLRLAIPGYIWWERPCHAAQNDRNVFPWWWHAIEGGCTAHVVWHLPERGLGLKSWHSAHSIVWQSYPRDSEPWFRLHYGFQHSGPRSTDGYDILQFTLQAKRIGLDPSSKAFNLSLLGLLYTQQSDFSMNQP